MDNSLLIFAESYQVLNYVYVSLATFWVWDCLITLDEEIAFLRNSKAQIIKILYVLTRLSPFVMLGLHVYFDFYEGDTPDYCLLIDTVASVFSLIIIFASDALFLLRVYALWGNNKWILAFLSISFVLAVGGTYAVGFVPSTNMPFLDIKIYPVTGCFYGSQGNYYIVMFVSFILLEIEIMVLTLLRAYLNRRQEALSKDLVKAIPFGSSGPKHNMQDLLITRNLLYVFVSLSLTIANLVTCVVLPDAYSGLLEDPQFVLNVVLATRMHRSLWAASEKRTMADCTYTDFINAEMEALDNIVFITESTSDRPSSSASGQP
ncbi:hypothetical protein CONPUDRAFT_159175 [Coniophora puteana RWD-64-598 SS2]|uniref:DUF6533 domain-containing protein n=1 Tax=Coniophora puteana (strain RWD-64-598) TaxID=741705 RepID=A0A5M3M8Z7_CONPW|nr:uncharacterized protein CONPUDRAFT_159175 [Coniophora puteana RWD-64-598 SS2]EIW75742.1 hypothetical protein CONPUDRAFT_159175 [Coniophora puteana RWD-64-598 SS2]